MAKEQSFRPLMYTAIEKGFSFNAFYRSLRDHGVPTKRRSDMLAAWAEVRTEVGQGRLYGLLSKDDVPEAIDVGTMRFTKPGAYYYKLKATVREGVRGKPTERFVTVVSEDPLSVGRIMEQIVEKWPSFEYGKRERLITTQLVAALHRPIP